MSTINWPYNANFKKLKFEVCMKAYILLYFLKILQMLLTGPKILFSHSYYIQLFYD